MLKRDKTKAEIRPGLLACHGVVLKMGTPLYLKMTDTWSRAVDDLDDLDRHLSEV